MDDDKYKRSVGSRTKTEYIHTIKHQHLTDPKGL
jgi:hypothetical protein